VAQPPQQPIAAPSQAIREEDLRAWMVEYGPALRRYFERRVGAAEAEDLVQDVFLHLQARAVGGAVDNVERYLFRIAGNVLVSRHRHRAARGFTLTDALDEALEPVETIAAERALIAKQDVARVIAAMQALPPRTREAFIFHRFGEMTYPAIAKRMGISVSAVGQLIARALEKLTEEVCA
jgi:RNA polymerase sigma factor (sigma-70 family)